MKEIYSNIGNGCRVIIGEGVLEMADGLLSSSKIGVVTNMTVEKLYLKHLKKTGTIVAEIPDGEEAKRLEVVEEVCNHLISNGLDRHSTIVGLGGGVVGDVAGFVAAIYMRGIDLVQIPTTLLAQIDSSIGGKTGVNTELGKNLIGAFHQPKLVLSDVSTLRTLSDSEIRNGLAEAVKYGVIEPNILDFLEENLDEIMKKNAESLEVLVSMCAALKLRIVEKDEKESDERMKLNLGHTIGHALERVSNFTISHGEAVSIGLVAAMKISHMPGRERVGQLLGRIGLPTQTDLDSSEILKAIEVDKKRKDGIRMVLPKKRGELEIVSPSPEKIAEALR